MTAWVRGKVAALAMATLLTGCVQEIKRDRVEDALVYAGIREPIAGCMARQMAQRLTIAQLRRLQELGGAHDWIDYLAAIRRIDDPQALSVTVTAFGLCRAGLIQ